MPLAFFIICLDALAQPQVQRKRGQAKNGGVFQNFSLENNQGILRIELLK